MWRTRWLLGRTLSAVCCRARGAIRAHSRRRSHRARLCVRQARRWIRSTPRGRSLARRILHSKDNTGAEIIRALLEAVEEHPKITVLENRMVVDLITEGSLARRTGGLPPSPDRVGLYALNTETDHVETYSAKVVELCTGGAGKVYLYTSNPDIASGDGVAIAYAQGLGCRTWSSSSFIPRASTIRMHGTS